MARGAQNDDNGGITYLNFQSGKFIQRVTDTTPGAIPRELKKGPNMGKIVHELESSGYEGQILNIEIDKDAGAYGKRLHIFLDITIPEQPTEIVKISLPLSSGAAKGFLSRLPVIEFNKDVTLKGWSIERDDKPGNFNSYLTPYQNGQKLAPQYTKENPQDMPKMVQIMVKGVPTWDDSDQLEFLEALVNSFAYPGLNSVKGGAAAAAVETQEEEIPEVATEAVGETEEPQTRDGKKLPF